MFLSTFRATVSAASSADALASVAKHIAKVDGFSLTGHVAVRSAKHGLYTVEILNEGGNVNDCWVVLTSFGIRPDKSLGSFWETVEGLN